ncbi:MutS-related protein [Yeosuana marina]|uniref:MutS-related protein n=1 Tax=Yeosuana marina TaxID=1565536 RepID=UPI0030EB2926
MAFKIDSQTISDLKIIGNSKEKDIYTLFNNTKTIGGSRILKDMFLHPCSNQDEISYRTNTIQYFKDHDFTFPFSTETFDTIEFYLENTDERTRLDTQEENLKHKFDRIIGADTHYQQLNKGVTNCLRILKDFSYFMKMLSDNGVNGYFHNDIKSINDILNMPELGFIKNLEKSEKIAYKNVVEYDCFFRFSFKNELLKLLYYAYRIDVFMAVAQVANELNFSFAEIMNPGNHILEMKGVYHPLVPNAVSNDIGISEKGNMIFLTGANMAGKSTFMKTFGIAMYLAHIGFPVPAKSMRFVIQNGMYSTINLADNLNMGFSHFYAEVARVKKVAQSVNKNDRLIVIFDELFRGTNVKDAHEATVAVLNAFAGNRKCVFIISTHIVEAAEELKRLRDNIKFVYLPTKMFGNVPQYTYKVEEGITKDRHGMLIIQNENILDILKSNC